MRSTPDAEKCAGRDGSVSPGVFFYGKAGGVPEGSDS